MLTIGTSATLTLTVTEDKTAAAVGSGLLPVFGTPCLIALMENAAVCCLADGLQSGQGSVGTMISVEHTAPTPMGMQVWATAQITGISPNGRLVDFTVSARDEVGPIGSGIHRRAIILNEKFLAKCEEKRLH